MSRTVRRCLFLLFALVSLPSVTPAQRSERDRESWLTTTGTVEVSGQVRIAEGSGQVSEVTVRVERFGGGGTLDQMQVDNRGRFRFANLPRGQYLVSVSARCFSAPQQQAELVHVFRSYLLFELKPDISSPDCRREAGAGAPGLIDARVPEEARKEYERASAALAKGKDSDALARLRRAVELYPDFFAAHMLMASAHTKAGRLEEAETSLERAAKIDPRSSAALVSLGEVRRRLKKHAEAEESLSAALKLEEASWQAHLALGRLYLDTDRPRSAAPHLGRALQLKPDSPDAHLFAGNLLLKLNEPARALVEYEEYLRLAPSGDYAAPARELVAKLRKAVAAKKED
jgi:tetratricopeptide (TPR) repeat protein